MGLELSWLERTPDKREVGSSTLPRPTIEFSDLKFRISGRDRTGNFERIRLELVWGPGVDFGAGWSSPVARWAHNPKVAGSNPAPATNLSGIWNFESRRIFRLSYRGCSSVGRAPRLQRGGQGFE